MQPPDVFTIASRRQAGGGMVFLTLFRDAPDDQTTSGNGHVDDGCRLPPHLQLVLDTERGTAGGPSWHAALLKANARISVNSAHPEMVQDTTEAPQHPDASCLRVKSFRAIASDVTIVRIAPEPAHIALAVAAAATGVLSVTALARALNGVARPDSDAMSRAYRLVQLHQEDTTTNGEKGSTPCRFQVNQLIKEQLRHMDGSLIRRGPPNRPPRHSKVELAALADAEIATAGLLSRYAPRLLPPATGDDDVCLGEVEPLAGLFEAGANPCRRGPGSRSDYVHGKKRPQVLWFLRELRALITAGRPHPALVEEPVLFVDVGGGRGDLSLAIAQRFPAARVVCIDRNAESLLSGLSRAQRAGLPNIRFVEGSVAPGPSLVLAPGPFSEVAQENNCDFFATLCGNLDPGNRFTKVCFVGLHACGALTDDIIGLAASHPRGTFLVCPCCYGKHPGLLSEPFSSGTAATQPPRHPFDARSLALSSDPGSPVSVSHEVVHVLNRLAESKDRPVSYRAMSVLCAMRLRFAEELMGRRRLLGSAAAGASSALVNYCSRLDFPIDFSSRNIVLCGTDCPSRFPAAEGSR